MNALAISLEQSGSTKASTLLTPQVTVPIQQQLTSLNSDFTQNLDAYKQNYQIETSPSMDSIRNVLNSNGLGNQTPISQRSITFIVNIQWTGFSQAQHVLVQDLGLPLQRPANLNKLTIDLGQANELYLALKGNMDNLANLTQSISQIVVRTNAQQITPTTLGTIVAFFMSTILVGLIGYLIYRTITAPLGQLTALTKRIGKGEMHARASLRGNNEITTVGNSMNTMLDTMVSLMQNVEHQRDDLQARIEALMNEVKGVGNGDLSIQANVTNDTFGILAKSFNYMLRELSGLVVRVKLVTREVGRLTSVTLDYMEQLVQVDEEQVKQIAISKEEMQKLSILTAQMSQRSNILTKIANDTRQAVNEGRFAVQQSVAGMERIHDNVKSAEEKVQLLGGSSQEINNIVKVISSIAFHTNRLALNAAIQASTAGTNSKGFEVLAMDIRSLSEQTKAMASSIADMVYAINDNISKVTTEIRDSERETAYGTQLAQQVDTVLATIFDAIEQQAKEIEHINGVANQQLKSSRNVTNTMEGVSETTKRNSRHTHDAAQNVWELTRLVVQLNTSVSAFRVREEQKYVSAQPQPPHISSTVQNRFS